MKHNPGLEHAYPHKKEALTQVAVSFLISSTTCVGGCTACSALGVARCSRSLSPSSEDMYHLSISQLMST